MIRTNQIRSIAYNVIAVALAAAGWVNPLIAAILMPLSSALVVAGAAGLEGRVRGLLEGAGMEGAPDSPSDALPPPSTEAAKAAVAA